MTDIKSMNMEELKELMTQIGEKPFRAKQIYGWLHEHLVTSYDEMANLPKSLKQKLADYPITALETLDVQISKVDGTRKYLFCLADGNMIEVFVNNGEYVITNAVYDLSDELSGNAELFGLACAEE